MPRKRKTTPRDPELAALGWAVEVLMARSPRLKQADIADGSDLDGNQVSSYICGQVSPTFHNLLQLCAGLRVAPIELMALVEEHKAQAERTEPIEPLFDMACAP